CGGGCGVLFKLSPGGTETVLHTLNGFPSDGSQPEAGLIADSSGNLYGTTSQGGASGNGVVFKLSPGGTETVLYSFKGGSDGSHPQAGLIADSSGILYGTTPRGGGSVSGCDGGAGCGVVFKLSPGGTETVLYAFTNGSDGGEPLAGLIADSRGNLYGTTFRGGALGSGTVFKLAGTGFVPAIPFSAFGAKLGIQFGPTPNHDRFQIQASFTLGSASTGINPVAEPVTLQIGAFAVTIPPGSFTGTGFGPFAFGGVIDGVTLEVRIAPTGTKRYAFIAAAGNANLTGTVNPVPVTLTIGDDSGPTSVTAAIASGVATAH
ncbi:MAG: choice-of-anchor tandem repeat GloVer-containing protein, partial [Methylocella sp.]